MKTATQDRRGAGPETSPRGTLARGASKAQRVGDSNEMTNDECRMTNACICVEAVIARYHCTTGAVFEMRYELRLYSLPWITRNAVSVGRERGYVKKGAIRFRLERNARLRAVERRAL